jgi:hypothetical protein
MNLEVLSSREDNEERIQWMILLISYKEEKNLEKKIQKETLL